MTITGLPNFNPMNLLQPVWKLLHEILSRLTKFKHLQGPTMSLQRYPRGLRNLGNTCFLNSVLQAFSAFPQLEIYLQQSTVKRAMPFTKKLLLCLQEMRPRLMPMFAFNPYDIYTMISTFNKNFRGNQQQDAQELFQTISALLAEESRQRTRLNFQSGLKPYSNAIIEKAIAKQKNIEQNSALTVEEMSQISKNPFEGLLASQVTCQKCKYTRPVQHETFVNISLSIPNAPASSLPMSVPVSGRGAAGRGSLKLSSDISIYDCLNLFTTGEFIDDVECPSCTTLLAAKAEQRKIEEATKKTPAKKVDDQLLSYIRSLTMRGEKDQCLVDLDDESLPPPPSPIVLTPSQTNEDDEEMSFTALASTWPRVRTRILKKHSFSRFPTILCLHLCRRVFSESTGQMVKIVKHVRFPVQLDLAKYFYFDEHPDAAPSTNNNIESPTGAIYLLKAVVVHYGNAESGHYATYCQIDSGDKSKRSWMLFSDEKTQRVDEAQVLDSQAYLLFYEKKKPFS